MRVSRSAVLAFVVICAFALGGFVQSAWAAAVQTPAKVVLTPKNPAVIIGKTQTFTAKVLDKAGNKINTVVPLTWSLAQAATDAGCTIDQDGVLTVPDTAAAGPPLSKAVTAAVTATPTILGTAGFSIIDTPFTGGVFIGTVSCTTGNCVGQSEDLALDAAARSFNGLIIDSTLKLDYQTFPGTIAKTGDVKASFSFNKNSVKILGQLNYVDGVATSASGTWTSTKKGTTNSGTWTTALASTPGAGGKVGTWTIPAVKTPTKAAGLAGPLVAIFKDDGSTVVAVAETRTNGQLTGGVSVPGTWTGDSVSFPAFAEGGTAANASTHATGTYVPASKNATGEMLNAGDTSVGTWKLNDIK